MVLNSNFFENLRAILINVLLFLYLVRFLKNDIGFIQKFSNYVSLICHGNIGFQKASTRMNVAIKNS
jgi:hypothetical protein